MKGKPLMVIKNVKDVVRSGLPKKLMELCSRVALLEVSWDKIPRLEGGRRIQITKFNNGYVMEIDNRDSIETTRYVKVFDSLGGIITELLDRFEHRSPSRKGLSCVKVTIDAAKPELPASVEVNFAPRRPKTRKVRKELP